MNIKSYSYIAVYIFVALAQSFHQEDSLEVGFFSECTTAETHHSAPLTNELLIQQAGDSCKAIAIMP